MKQLLITISSIMILFTGCKHDTDEFQGPPVRDYFGEFYIISDLLPTTKVVDFSKKENVVFNMEFSRRAKWKLEIKGLSSGAVKTIENSSRVLSEENALWDGDANTFPSFGAELAAVKLSFIEEDSIFNQTDTIEITGLRADEGILVTTFETPLCDTCIWSQTTVNARFTCDANAAKSNCYFSFNGTVGWDWAHGSIDLRQYQHGYELPANASNLFFNVGLKAVESIGPQSSFFQFTFQEDDNGDGVFDPESEDSYVYQYWTETSDWVVHSKKYEDLKFDAEGNTIETAGNGLTEPSKLINIQVFYLSNPENGNAQAYVDHMIFTQNEEYRP